MVGLAKNKKIYTIKMVTPNQQGVAMAKDQIKLIKAQEKIRRSKNCGRKVSRSKKVKTGIGKIGRAKKTVTSRRVGRPKRVGAGVKKAGRPKIKSKKGESTKRQTFILKKGLKLDFFS